MKTNTIGGALINSIKNDVAGGRNVVIMATGKVGTGKSYTLMSLAEKLDPNFDEDRVCFTVKEFLELLNRQGSDKLKAGSCVILDEVGVMAGARNFQSEVNKALSAVFQIFRHRRLVVLLSVPHEKLTDLHLRVSLDYRLQTVRIDKGVKMTKCRLFSITMLHGTASMKSGLMYFEKFPRVLCNGSVSSMRLLWIGKPSDELCTKYEKKASKYKISIVQKQEDKLFNKPEKEVKMTAREQIEQAVKADPTPYLTEKRGNLVLDPMKLAAKLNVSLQAARNTVKILAHVED